MTGRIEVGPLALDYYSTSDLTAPCKRLIVVVHGDSRNADDHLRYITEAGPPAGTTVVAPHFVTAEDEPPDDRHVWSNGGWKRGDKSSNGRVSSFEVIDTLIRSATFETLVLAGHSAGGQFVNRYVSGSPITATRYVVANPSSYLYLDGRRKKGKGFAIPTEAQRAACPGYDTYKYGLTDLNTYMALSSPDLIRSRYRERSVTVLLGSLDTATDAELDIGCEAMWQGTNRLERGKTFSRYTGTLAGHRTDVVSGVGHEARKMYASTAGKLALFA